MLYKKDVKMVDFHNNLGEIWDKMGIVLKMLENI
jgi:hypothetical protein